MPDTATKFCETGWRWVAAALDSQGHHCGVQVHVLHAAALLRDLVPLGQTLALGHSPLLVLISTTAVAEMYGCVVLMLTV